MLLVIFVLLGVLSVGLAVFDTFTGPRSTGRVIWEVEREILPIRRPRGDN